MKNSEQLTTSFNDSSILNQLNDIFISAKKYYSPFLLLKYPNKPIHLASYCTESDGFFSFVSFDQQQNIVLNNVEMIDLESIEQFNAHPSHPPAQPKNEITLSYTHDMFTSLVNTAKKKIKEGYFKKVVLSQTQRIHTGIESIKAYFNLCDKFFNTAAIYCFYHPRCGTWIGASPELVLSGYASEKYTTTSLAGTKKKHEIWTFKEFDEQKIVTDYIIDKLSTVNCTRLNISDVFTQNYGTIDHLKTLISFKSKDGIDQLMAALHPTPAICGMPKMRAFDFITTHELHERKFYTGYFGWNDLSMKESKYYVNLRCMNIHDDGFTIYTGAGITLESHAEKEWSEVLEKSQNLIDCIFNGTTVQ